MYSFQDILGHTFKDIHVECLLGHTRTCRKYACRMPSRTYQDILGHKHVECPHTFKDIHMQNALQDDILGHVESTHVECLLGHIRDSMHVECLTTTSPQSQLEHARTFKDILGHIRDSYACRMPDACRMKVRMQNAFQHILQNAFQDILGHTFQDILGIYEDIFGTV